jgi:RNA polymerase sigma-54 factor
MRMATFRRDLDAVVDNIAFNHGKLVDKRQVDQVRKQIQALEPVGIASRDLRDCLHCQVKFTDGDEKSEKLPSNCLKKNGRPLKKSTSEKLKNRLDVDDEMLKKVFELIRGLNPRPGAVINPDEEGQQYIEPDFEVYFEPDEDESDGEGQFVIRLNQRNVPPLRISPEYKMMWDNLKKKKQKERISGEEIYQRES